LPASAGAGIARAAMRSNESAARIRDLPVVSGDAAVVHGVFCVGHRLGERR
jgi:hypothetical protein